MYKDGKIIQRVCELTCTDIGLRRFNTMLSGYPFGDSSYFDKYYSLDTIKKAIQKYKDGKITARYLADWATAYNYIIMGFFHDNESDTETYRELLRWQIADVLDSLSFFDESQHSEIDDYIKIFEFYNDLYVNYTDFKAYYVRLPDEETEEDSDDEDSWNNNNIIMILVNEKKKEYIVMNCIFEFLQLKTNMENIEMEQARKMLDKLDKNGYKKTVNVDDEIMILYNLDEF